jgi:hypothetical protein
MEPAGFAPSVTVEGLNAREVLAGCPLAAKITGFASTLYRGDIVILYLACCPKGTMPVVGETEIEKSGGNVTVVMSVAVSFATLSSPPPATVAVFVTLDAVFVATLTVTVITG